MHDVRLQYERALDESHQGRPSVVTAIHDGGRGRPHIYIDPTFLSWAYNHRSTSSIARFLGVGRTVVRNALLDYGIAVPQQRPFSLSPVEPDSSGYTLNHLPNSTQNSFDASEQPSLSFTGPLSTISDPELDRLLVRLRAHFRRAGISMLDGMLRRLGYRLPRERIRSALVRIEPVQRVFQRTEIRRRQYHVAGPNALWHHDGQHAKLYTFIKVLGSSSFVSRSYSMGHRNSWIHRRLFQPYNRPSCQ